MTEKYDSEYESYVKEIGDNMDKRELLDKYNLLSADINDIWRSL